MKQLDDYLNIHAQPLTEAVNHKPKFQRYLAKMFSNSGQWEINPTVYNSHIKYLFFAHHTGFYGRLIVNQNFRTAIDDGKLTVRFSFIITDGDGIEVYSSVTTKGYIQMDTLLSYSGEIDGDSIWGILNNPDNIKLVKNNLKRATEQATKWAADRKSVV